VFRRTFPIVLISGLLFCLAGGRAARAQSLPAVLIQGRASGFGEIGIGAGRIGEFRFQLDPRTAGRLVPGEITFRDRLTGLNLVSQQITDGFVTADQVFVEGVCTVNGFLMPFQMQASAARAPGQQAFFFICYGNSFSGACVGDFLVSGRILLDPSLLP
jgi:hypothetical protein